MNSHPIDAFLRLNSARTTLILPHKGIPGGAPWSWGQGAARERGNGEDIMKPQPVSRKKKDPLVEKFGLDRMSAEAAQEIRADQAANPQVADHHRLVFGKHVVADPKICHGKLTFAGTRIFVTDILDMVAEGNDWDYIIKEWHGSISREAISEAVRLATRAFLDHAGAYGMEALSGEHS